jgi:hypothetical protein
MSGKWGHFLFLYFGGVLPVFSCVLGFTPVVFIVSFGFSYVSAEFYFLRVSFLKF